MAAPFTFDRRWHFEIAPDELWAVLARTEDYPRWWSWLAGFESGGLCEGAEARFTVRPPLPYRLHVHVVLDRVEPGCLVEGTVSGDLGGRARMELAPAGLGTEARLVWSLELRRPLLVAGERVARPAMAWAHDVVVAVAARQFRQRALGG